ncbi:hypothetical protein [Altererythrobacter sp. MF3-039]|uniref:hypothetical protein n=1 Tax=Altererythrobacter sp. MF3-039 TaxID=3252901 RepID=UPI00390C810E
MIWAILGIWFLIILGLAIAGTFDAPPGEFPAAMVACAGGPPLTFYLATRLSSRLRNWVARCDLAEITALQAWRVIGAAFLFAWATQVLPPVFAFPAGIGDILVGIGAPVAALAVARNLPHAHVAAWGVVVAGMADFMIVVSIGLLARSGLPLHFDGQLSTDAMGQAPFVLFPTFLVPAFIVLHIIAVMKLMDE